MSDRTSGHPALPWRRVHLVGIGGVGMAGIAHILRDLGVTVSGSDAAESGMVRTLRARGIEVSIGHDAAAVDGADIVVYSNAVPESNPERRRALELGLPARLRGAFLAELATCFDQVVCVAGSHGKTTTTAMLAHILRGLGLDAGYLVGGSVTGWRRAAAAGDRSILVTEVDESDGTQALMRAALAVVTNVEDDHFWSLGGLAALEANFAEFASRADRVVAWDGPGVRRVLAGHPRVRLAGEPERLPPGVVPLPGGHNRANATLAVLAAEILGCERPAALAALASFRGVERRLSVRWRDGLERGVLVEDYAHHPTELRAAIAALRESWPEHTLTVVFQPHRYERIRHYGQEFAAVLSGADRVVVAAPFAAWLNDAQLADPRGLAEAVKGPPCCYWDAGFPELANKLLRELPERPWVVAVVGAGDVQDLVPRLAAGLTDARLENLRQRLHEAGVQADRERRWADLTTLGVGTDRPLRALPRTTAELAAALRQTAAAGLPVFFLGAGSNLVGTDREPPRLVLSLSAGEFVQVTMMDGFVRAGSGVCLGPLARGMAAAGVGHPRLAPLAWVPGSLGGAVRLNAGAAGVEIGMLVRAVHGLRLDGTPWSRAGGDIAWGYRTSDIPADVVVTAVDLLPGTLGGAEMDGLIEAEGQTRRARQPWGRSAGCVFRNPPGDSAGRLLEAAGCKGWRQGSLVVSDRHANFILNERDCAAEADFAALVERCRERVRECSGIVLQEEVHWSCPPW